MAVCSDQMSSREGRGELVCALQISPGFVCSPSRGNGEQSNLGAAAVRLVKVFQVEVVW
jgi:hypothetical protein